MRSHLIKKESKLPLRFSYPLAEAVGPLPHKERHFSFPLTALISQRSGDQSLPRARWAIKQTAPENRRMRKTLI